MIPQRDLSRLSNRLLQEQGGRRIPERVLERDYCLSWFLVGLSRSPLRERLLFKGGTALKKCYFPDYRFSEDLDFTLEDDKVQLDTIRRDLEVAFAEAHRSSGVVLQYARDDRHSHTNSYTFYLGYEGPLPGDLGGKEVKTDITIREKIIFDREEKPLLRGYAEYDDVPEDAVIRVYSLHEIATEKAVALVDPARNEPRDLYDLWYLCEHVRQLDLGELTTAISQKLAFREKTLESFRGQLARKEANLRATWDHRLRGQMAILPEFDEVFRGVRRAFRQAGLG